MRRSVLSDQSEREQHQAGRSKIITVESPDGLEAIRKTYGWPIDAEGKASKDFKVGQLDMADLPFPMRLSWSTKDTVTRIMVHRKVAASMMDALTDIRDYRGTEYLQENDLDLFGGVYNVRLKRGNPKEPSTHSWGIAIDINPHRGQLGKPSSMPDFIVQAFKERGWIWGGDWNYPDGMHFQACKGY